MVHILIISIINMLRSCVQPGHIAFLLHYINGRVDDRSDDIIRDSVLYDCICRILDRLIEEDTCSGASVRAIIGEDTVDYAEARPCARERLNNAPEIIVAAYHAAVLKRHADGMLADLRTRAAVGVG